MAKQVINVGSAPGANDGETIRAAFIKVNENTTELYDEVNRVENRIDDIQITGGSGTVLSVTVAAGEGLEVTNPTVETIGTITLSVNSEEMKSVLGVDGLESELGNKQPLSEVLTNTTAPFTIELEDKLSTVEEGATVNESDENLLSRDNHTGEQAISTIIDLEETLDNKLDKGLTIPLVRGTVEQYLTAVEGYYYFDAKTVADAHSVVNLGSTSGDFEFNGSLGLNLFVTATDDLNFLRLINTPFTDKYTLRIRGGKSPSCKISFAEGVQIPVALPDEGDGEDENKVILEEGKILILTLADYDVDDVSYTEIGFAETLDAPVEIAPAISSHTITPDVGFGAQIFTSNHSITGNPVPSVSYKWFLNGVEISGATSKTYTATIGQDGEYLSEITVDNGIGAPLISTATARIGRAIPFKVAEYVMYSIPVETYTLAIDPGDVYTPQVGDFALFYAVQQNNVDTNLPVDFTRMAASIPRQAGTLINGDNFRSEYGFKVLDEDDISSGEFLGVVIRAHSLASISIWRGVDSWDLDTAGVVRGSATPASSNSVNLHRPTATAPARAVTFASSGTHFLHTRVSTLDGWNAGVQCAPEDLTQLARHGGRIFDKQVGSGQTPAGTVVAAGSPTPNASWHNITALLYGPED